MMHKFRIKALCRTKYGARDVTRILDAETVDQAREKMSQRFAIITVQWIKQIDTPEAS